MLDRLVNIFLKKLSQEVDAFTLADEIMIDHGFDVGDVDPVPAQDDLGFGRYGSDRLRHLSGLLEIGNDETDSHVIVSLFQFLPESLQGRKIQNRCRHVHVFSQEIEPLASVIEAV